MKYLRHLESKNSSKSGVVAFISVLSDVKEAIECGYTAKLIWEDLKETKRIDFGYRQFCYYVNKHVKQNNKVEQKTKPEINKTKQQQREEYAAKYMESENPFLKQLRNKN